MMMYMTTSPASELIEYIRKLRYTPKLEATTWYIFMQIRHVIVSVRVVIPGNKRTNDIWDKNANYSTFVTLF